MPVSEGSVNSELIAIGTEILLGEITDTNSVYLARVLRDHGINVFYMTSVGDNRARIAQTIREAMARSNLVITCGGLGPTIDDMTRQAVADATDRDLEFHQPLLDAITERFRSFRATMTDNNRRQAFIPRGATILDNPVGTAPAFLVEHNGSVVVSLPGVPRELKYLMSERVLPILHERFRLGVIMARVLHTAGIGESMLDDMIGVDLLEANNPTVGLAAHNGQVDVRITAKADNLDAAQALINITEQQLRLRVGKHIYGTDTETLETVFQALLKQTGSRVGLVDAGLAGALSSALAATPQHVWTEMHAGPAELAAAYDSIGTGLRALTEKVAETAMSAHGLDACIVIASQPDVDEAADSSEGTAVTVRVGQVQRSRQYGFGGRSELVRHWVTTWTLAQVWAILKEGTA